MPLLTIQYFCVIFCAALGGAILKKSLNEIALAIFEKHHAPKFKRPLRYLFEILRKEQAFNYQVMPEEKIKEFFDLVEQHLAGDDSKELYLLEKAPLVWKAYLSRRSRDVEIRREIPEISEYTQISEKELAEFFGDIKKMEILKI